MPGSALTRLLNATPELVTSADLSVIAGDIEAGDGLWNTLKVLATDWFYKNEHDLVVDTASMLGGLPRLGGAARYRQDQGPKVNHFRYFTNDQSVRWLSAGLSRADGDNAGFQSLAPKPAAAPRCAAAIARSRGGNKPRPIAVVLPGTMGSELTASDDPVWLNYWALLKGGLKKIAMVATASRRSGWSTRSTGRWSNSWHAATRSTSSPTTGASRCARPPPGWSARWSRWLPRPNARASRCAWLPTRWAGWSSVR